jgi:Fibronectin type III domain
MSQRLAVLALVPSLAMAQSITFAETNTSGQDGKIDIAECQATGPAADHLTIKFTMGGSPTIGTGFTYLLVASTQDGCPTNATVNKDVNVIPAVGTAGQFPNGTTATSYDVSTDILQKLGIPCVGQTSHAYFCVTLRDGSGVAVVNAKVTGSMLVDGVRPPAPALSSVQPTPQALTATWVPGADASGGTATARYRIEATSQSNPADKHSATITGGSQTSGSVGGLTNDATYDVVVIALSEAGNESPPSAALSGTPVAALDFWHAYQQSGGHEQGGCATGGGELLALVALASLALRRVSPGAR